MTIGFIGLGNMGTPMAQNLIKAGYHLQVYNRTIAKADELEQASITKCNTPAEAAANVQFVVSMLSEDEILKEAVSGENGLLHTFPKGGVHISMSTISPETSQLLSGLHEQAGSHYIAAPVFGRPEAAAAKKLFVCTSGAALHKAAAQPILEALGQSVTDFGEDAGAANVLKIAGNFMIIASLELMAEAFTLAEKNGLDRVAVANFFGSTLFNAPIYQNYGKLIANKQYQPVGFKARLGLKDARLAIKLSQTSHTPMPLAMLAHNRLLTAVAKGGGDNDWVEAFGKGVTDDAGI
ncbi:3-hydroxyisobutyrate dehydrogenase-like beta-hydroxyacid dehydrogenase [Mucilaginibacter gracilis]|uniref:3-hydroxyisobutyrate dehydrogenase-like beta-hydroxyacid dehydrogenase n=1 Tax=Mucilaginibacter gracilis TaxID=423350 RepID=A0A495J8D9_9SPHI|nr:NAD(P)-dependent oxidoreductase [Mucilaginibacter gracilis]RKR85245.1 3-hydroxyisobutyrate dehydrogenase-like beta-hydroxyacid dehydrogenase [Mucilaginibacter gracilis]